MAERVAEIPDTTAELVEVAAYLKTSREETVFKLKQDIGEAAERLDFLLDYATLPCE